MGYGRTIEDLNLRIAELEERLNSKWSCGHPRLVEAKESHPECSVCYKERIAELEAELAESERERKVVQAELFKTSAELEECKDELSWESTRRCDALLDQEAKFHKETEALRSRIAELEAERDRLRAEIESYHNLCPSAWRTSDVLQKDGSDGG